MNRQNREWKSASSKGRLLFFSKLQFFWLSASGKVEFNKFKFKKGRIRATRIWEGEIQDKISDLKSYCIKGLIHEGFNLTFWNLLRLNWKCSNTNLRRNNQETKPPKTCDVAKTIMLSTKKLNFQKSRNNWRKSYYWQGLFF